MSSSPTRGPTGCRRRRSTRAAGTWATRSRRRTPTCVGLPSTPRRSPTTRSWSRTPITRCGPSRSPARPGCSRRRSGSGPSASCRWSGPPRWPGPSHRRLGGDRCAAWAFWLAAASPVLANAWIIWAHAPSALAGGLLVLATMRARCSPSWLLGVAGAAALGVLLRSEGILWALAVAVAVLLFGRDRRAAWTSVSIVGATGIAIVGERLWIDAVLGGSIAGELESSRGVRRSARAAHRPPDRAVRRRVQLHGREGDRAGRRGGGRRRGTERTPRPAGSCRRDPARRGDGGGRRADNRRPRRSRRRPLRGGAAVAVRCGRPPPGPRQPLGLGGTRVVPAGDRRVDLSRRWFAPVGGSVPVPGCPAPGCPRRRRGGRDLGLSGVGGPPVGSRRARRARHGPGGDGADRPRPGAIAQRCLGGGRDQGRSVSAARRRSADRET